MNPSTAIRSAAYAALATAAGLDPADPDYAPLVGARASFGTTFPTQSATPGAAPFPAELLIYGWDAKSESVSGPHGAPQLQTTMTLVVEARVEVKASAQFAAQFSLPGSAGEYAIAAALDGVLDALCFAVKKAVCGYIQRAAIAFHPEAAARPWIEEIKSVETANKYGETGQRIPGNAACTFDLVFGEHFDPPVPSAPLTEAWILVMPSAGAEANADNDGNGTIAAVTPLLGVAPGTYALSFSTATAFTVTPPVGAPVTGTVGTPFAGLGLAFTVAPGIVPFQAGDGFSIFVSVAAEQTLDLSR